MLVFRFGANDDLFNFGIFLMGDTYDILKEILIESFFSGDVPDIVNLVDLTRYPVQWDIVCLIWLSVGLTKNEPAAIIFL